MLIIYFLIFIRQLLIDNGLQIGSIDKNKILTITIIIPFKLKNCYSMYLIK